MRTLRRSSTAVVEAMMLIAMGDKLVDLSLEFGDARFLTLNTISVVVGRRWRIHFTH